MGMEAAEVYLWGTRIGVVAVDDGDMIPRFQHVPDFLDSQVEVSPLMMPLRDQVYAFPELAQSEAFKGLPGLLADSLPDKFGNAVLDAWLSENGRGLKSRHRKFMGQKGLQ